MRFLRDSRDPWKVHGYVFSFSFGVFGVSIVWLFAKLLGIPSGVPLNKVLTPGEQAAFVLLLGVSGASAYLLARLTSYAAHVLFEGLRRKRN